MKMERDKILKEKDRVQKRLWKEAKRSSSGYAALVHRKAQKVRETASGKTAGEPAKY
jgi:hypothetical protein